MRRKDRQLPHDEARAILERGEYGVLSTVSPEGAPYGVPLNYACRDDVIYVHGALAGQKLDNIEVHRRVSFCVVGHTEVLPRRFSSRYESVIVTGDATEAVGDEKRKGLVELLKKYSPPFLPEGQEFIEKAGKNARVLEIRILALTGKASRWTGV